MRSRAAIVLTVLAGLLLAVAPLPAQRAAILRDVKIVQVDATEVPNPEKVKEDFAPQLLQDQLRNALRSANFEVGEAPIRAHIVLEEFSSGSKAKRLLLGFGSGRSTVAGRLVFKDAEGKELANVPLKTRGEFFASAYQGNETQRRKATSAFEQKLLEELARLK